MCEPLNFHRATIVFPQPARLLALSGAREPSLISLASLPRKSNTSTPFSSTLCRILNPSFPMEPSSPSRITASESDVCHYNSRNRLCGSRCGQRLHGSSHRARELLLFFFFHPRDPAPTAWSGQSHQIVGSLPRCHLRPQARIIHDGRERRDG